VRVVVQRVAEAAVRTGDGVAGAIGSGMVILVGFAPNDDLARVSSKLSLVNDGPVTLVIDQ